MDATELVTLRKQLDSMPTYFTPSPTKKVMFPNGKVLLMNRKTRRQLKLRDKNGKRI